MEDNTNITAEQTVEATAEEVQTTPTGEAAEAEAAAPEDSVSQTADETEVDIGIDIENDFVDDQPEKVIRQRAKEKGMSMAEYNEYIANLENEAEVNRLMNEGYTREEAIKEAKYTLLDKKLKAREEHDQRKARYTKEMREFKELYPEVDKKRIPKEVWDAVSNGADLSSAYAKYERKKAIQAAKAQALNEKVAKTAAPEIKKPSETDKDYTFEEIAKMSPEEVKKNYDAIIKSLNRKK